MTVISLKAASSDIRRSKKRAAMWEAKHALLAAQIEHDRAVIEDMADPLRQAIEDALIEGALVEFTQGGVA